MLPNFFQENFSAIGFLKVRDQNKGKCCPFYSKKIFGPLDFVTFVIKAGEGENAAQFFYDDFSAIRFLKFSSSMQGKMLPNLF